MIFWIKITYVTSRCNELFKLRSLVDKIRLVEQKTAAAAVNTARLAFKSITLGKESSSRVKAPLTENLFHALKITRKSRVIIREVKLLYFTIGKSSGAHFRAILVVGPSIVGVFGHLPCRQSIVCPLLVTRCIIKKEESLSKAIGLILKDVNGMVNLCEKIITIKVTIAILPGFEYNSCLSVDVR